MTNSYPRSLAGLYEIDFDLRKIIPVAMIDSKSSDHALKEVRFNKNKTADAEFENGVCVNFQVKWDGIDDSYSFNYNGHPHGFSTKKNLGEELKYVDVMSITDFDPDQL